MTKLGRPTARTSPAIYWNFRVGVDNFKKMRKIKTHLHITWDAFFTYLLCLYWAEEERVKGKKTKYEKK